MQQASARLRAGDFAGARVALEQLLAQSPRFVEARRLLASALQGLGDDVGAERELRAAVAIDPGWVPTLISFGGFLAERGRNEEAETMLRGALKPGRDRRIAIERLMRLLNASGRPHDALDVCASFAGSVETDCDILTQQAVAMSALGRQEESLAVYRRIHELLPEHPVAGFNLAAALETAGREAEAEPIVRRVIAKGAGMAEAHLVHARALIALDRFDEAETTLRRALELRPAYADAHRNLAQLIWMRSGDLRAASEDLDSALRAHPDADALHLAKAALLDGVGDTRAAHAWLTERVRAPSASLELLLATSDIALRVDPDSARACAERAIAIAPGHSSARLALADALIVTGDPAQAERIVSDLLIGSPNDQRLIASLTTAWRLLGDPRHDAHCDYPNMARSWTIDTPTGWSNLPSYLRDLAASLHELHGLHAHPLHQSLRGGSQTSRKNLLDTDDPPIRAFAQAIDGPIRRHMLAIGSGTDPLRRRNSGDYRIQGIWSVRLRGEGYHVNHVHPQGWLSSACYIQLPQALGSGDSDAPTADANADVGAKAGWLKFGEPGLPTAPPLAPEFFIRPEPGLLALFPSYFWHGTVPFVGADTRMTIAFDVVPVTHA